MIGLARMRAAAAAGTCLACGDLLPPREPGRGGRGRVICDDDACMTAYQRLYGRDRYRRRERIRWICGCGKQYVGKHLAQNCLFAFARWPLVVVPAPRAA